MGQFSFAIALYFESASKKIPSQVMQACEEALRRLEISNMERNAVLETLRYCEQSRLTQLAEESTSAAAAVPNGLPADRSATSGANLPLTQ